MNILQLSNLGVLVFTAAALVGLGSDAQEGRVLAAPPATATRLGTGEQGRGMPSKPATELSSGMLAAHFQVTVYEVQGALEQIQSLEIFRALLSWPLARGLWRSP